ncbi:MAG: TIGR04255 family protein [Polyangiaceae bacterium]
MTGDKGKQFPELRRPPIVEVVCGVVFEPVLDLDALMLGVYWDRRRDDFPKRQLHPALSDEAGFAIGIMPMRAFLISGDDQFILQLQHDRFFMNWRASGQDYPRFSEQHGEGGLLTRMEGELEKFRSFVREKCGSELVPRRIELSKIDLLEKGRHWKDVADLASLLPVTGAFQEVQRTEDRDVNLRFVDRGPDGTVIVHVASLNSTDGAQALRVDARFVADPTPSVRDAFHRGNQILNDAFFKLIPDAAKRFGMKGG